MEDEVTEMDEELLSAVLGRNSIQRNTNGCGVGQILDKMREAKPVQFETFMHLIDMDPQKAKPSVIADRLNAVAKLLVTEEYEVPIKISGATVSRHRGNVSNPCKCREVYAWMTN